LSSIQGTPVILKLDSPEATLERVGGKGASLGRMAAAGLPVPPGFHITTHAYRRFVSENRLEEAILSAAAHAGPDGPTTFEQASEQIQSLIAKCTIPEDVAALIVNSDQMQRGDILVAKVTTPAWTALFALAAGVVTDVGGPLSHSSIVAREYHIPAVLGTGVATERVRSGQHITVDGDAGTVRIVD